MKQLLSLLTFLLICSSFSACSSNPSAQTLSPTVQPEENNRESVNLKEVPDKKIARIEMEKGGTIDLELFPDTAPKTVANFKLLINKGFYNGLTFHRVIPGFVAQGGCPLGNGTGDPGYKIPAEFNQRPHLRGTLAMARAADPNSAGSQFYICLAPQPSLNGKYTVFGQVIAGMDIVDQIRIGDRMKKVILVSPQ